MGNYQKKGSFLTLLALFLQLMALSLLAVPTNSYAALPVITVQSSGGGGACSFNFADTYYNAQTATPQTIAATSTGWNSQPPILQLQFGSDTPYTNTPAVPCDGYYQVFFSIQIRNDSGMSCKDGLNSMAVWSTTTDSATPNAYGCPTRWYQGYWSGSNWVNTSYSLNPGGNNIAMYACATFNQYVQCAWGNTGQFGGMGSCCGGYGINAYPLFMYTNYWTRDGANSVYTAGWFGGQYVEAYGGFCHGYDHQWSNGGYCQLNNSWPAVNAFNSAYCSSKPFYFKNVIYLHKGATVSAPSLQGLMAQTPYPNAFISGGQYAVCGVSVIGGKFSLNYLHK